jgi:hypothetical protein
VVKTYVKRAGVMVVTPLEVSEKSYLPLYYTQGKTFCYNRYKKTKNN